MGQDKLYEGLKDVDASLSFSAPYCAGLLALYSADIFRSEPLESDWAHNIGQNIAGQTAPHTVGNRGKRSISLNLKEPRAREKVTAGWSFPS